MADTSKPTNGGNGGTDIHFGIWGPSSNEAVVGVNPGVPVTVTGAFDSTTTKNFSVKVSLGSLGVTPGNATLSPPDSGQVSWTYHGVTTVGGPITIVATLYSGIDPTTTEKASAHVDVRVMALSSTIASPANGSTIKTWLGPTTATGTATFENTITSPQLLVSGDGGLARPAALDAGTVSGSQIVHNWSCPLVFTKPGQYAIQATAKGRLTYLDGTSLDVIQQLPATSTVKVQIDTTIPTVSITRPSADLQIPDDPNGATVPLEGTVDDADLHWPAGTNPSSGIKSIIVSGEGVTAPVTAQPTLLGPDKDKWSWKATVTLNPVTNPATDRGQRDLKVQVLDNANNLGNATVTVYLETAFQPVEASDQDESLSLLGYLRDLITFATKRINTDPTKGSAANLAVTDLVLNFYQPYDQLSQDEEVHQTRLCIEVLRKWLGTPVSGLADAEAAYGLAAYQELLLELGTSFQELRLARLADAKTRASLAARLGIDLEPTTPDKLDTLLLQPGNISESQLEQLFGLIDSTRNPLSLPPEPAILAWQKAHLRSSWKQQDYTPDPDPNFPVPLIDPDLLVAADFVPATATASNPALDLWNTRTAWVSSQLDDLRNDHSPGETDQARLYRLVGRLKIGPLRIVGPDLSMTILLDLDIDYNNGTRIDERLRFIPLSFPAFSYVIRLYHLAASGPLLADEWETLYSILVQVLKARQFSGWRLLEAQAGPITIDPALFQLNFDDVSLPEWRATAQARSRWQRTLAARIAQLDTVAQALQAAVNSAEESVLPQLRDALLAAIKVPTSVPTLFSTGLVAAGLTLADGAIDPHWTITANPAHPSGSGNFNAYTTINKSLIGPYWTPNTPLSRWISPTPDESGGDDPGSYTYKTSFDLTGFDLASVQVTIKVAVDNDLAEVKLNGQSLTNSTASGFAAFTTLPTITAGFVKDTNTLEFITNNGSPGKNPSGFRVEFTSSGIAQASPDWLSERLLIDMESSGAIKNTRVSQAIETLQEVFSSVRAGRFGIPGNNLGNIASWTIAPDIADANFDRDWEWMGSYATWYAAMEVFLYPENALAPSYQLLKSDAFAAVLDSLRMNPPLSQPLASTVNNLGVVVKQGLVDALYGNYSDSKSMLKLPEGSQPPQNWQDWQVGFKNVQKLILGSLADADLKTLRHDIQPNLLGKDEEGKDEAAPFPKTTLALLYWEIFYFVPVQLALQLQLAGRVEDALRCLRAVYAYDLIGEDRKIFYGLKAEEQPANPVFARSDNWIRALDPHGAIAPTRPNCYARFTLMSIVRCFLDFADSEFTHETPESLPQARDLYLNALELLAVPEMQPSNTGFQPNPVPQALATHALNNLSKLRNGLNIAGAKSVANPSIASGGAQLSLQANPSPQPTPYRYATLIERAKQLNQLAQQVENPYFAALQQIDAENYNLLKANQDLELAGANLNLQALQVDEADDGVTLARDQKARAQTQFDTYNNWILTGPLDSESDMIQAYKDGNEARDFVAAFSAQITVAQAIGAVSTATPTPWGYAAGFASAGGLTLLSLGQAIAQGVANEAEARAQIDSANASFERRLQEWQMQSSLAHRDIAIGQDNIQLANDKVDIANQQQLIAGIQDTHARAMVNFLNGKFTNVELYEWMSGVLGGVYRYFLQQSTAMALLAENQLSFERQQPNLAVIKMDYWQPPSQPTTQSASGGTPVDTRGLTGSARLLEDITQLDQYAFLTDSRKLQLTKTISLARLYPFEFQQFRETGVLPFATPMAIFDGDFPGHYLRLIKRARVSVVALIPPNQGIKATLSTTGISRVTIGGDVFQTIAVGRMPESIALTSPANASGLFELDAQPELLLPFEGTGVDTSWEFRMPLAANLFDYTTIADVLLTLDYTALNNYDYRQQVIQQLERGTSLDRAFSFRQDFADQWYELNNPDPSSVSLSVQFSTTEADFPPNIDELAIQNVLLHFVRAENQIFEVAALLTLAGKGGTATSIDSTISIRRGNASAWNLYMVGMPPTGNWELTLQDPSNLSGPGIRTLLATGAIQDILLVITYTGKLPAWD